MVAGECKVLLSPSSETDEGLNARNFYVAPHGFGFVHELGEADQRLGPVVVTFADMAHGPVEVGQAFNPDLIADDVQVTHLVMASVAALARR